MLASGGAAVRSATTTRPTAAARFRFRSGWARCAEMRRGGSRSRSIFLERSSQKKALAANSSVRVPLLSVLLPTACRTALTSRWCATFGSRTKFAARLARTQCNTLLLCGHCCACDSSTAAVAGRQLERKTAAACGSPSCRLVRPARGPILRGQIKHLRWVYMFCDRVSDARFCVARDVLRLTACKSLSTAQPRSARRPDALSVDSSGPAPGQIGQGWTDRAPAARGRGVSVEILVIAAADVSPCAYIFFCAQ